MESDARSSKILSVMEDGLENYDVFLSHRGPDTKTGFAGFLYKGLEDAGLRPFLDCKSIDKGKDSWNCTYHAIKTTPLALVIFSKRFAESEWCLKELHVMLDTPGVKVLPIFYKVQPCEVSFPEKGQLAAGFEKMKQRHDETLIEQWREDLKKASKLNGWEHKVADQRLERDFVKEIVGKVFQLVNKPLPLDVGEYVIGVNRVAEEIIQKLDDNKKVLMLGLWGMGGIGKSTLARELYNRLGKRFAANCYVEDVTEKVIEGGVVKVQNRVLKDLCENELIQIEDKSKGKIILEERLCRKQILLVLDDVCDSDEMDYWISHKMLSQGSMCIVTSRDRRVFEKSNAFDINHEIYIHDVQLLGSKDSKQVFTSYAFGGFWKVKPRFGKLVENISAACGGVPLVLKVCGALLKDEENVDIWDEVVKKLKCGTIMDERKIFECLRISYDALQQQHQEMFLDIACALLGESVDMAIRVWKFHGWSAAIGVRSLVERALIIVDDCGDFKMHDHLRDMGREIIRKKRVKEGIYRRLWMPESLALLEEDKALPDSLQTLIISNNSRTGSPLIDLDLSCLKELRIVICDQTLNVTSLLPKNLCWFDWKAHRHGIGNVFPVAPQNNKLLILILKGANIQSLPKSFGELCNLELMNLSYCTKLILLPDMFGILKNLKKLDLAHSGIQGLPESFGNLSKLEVLNMNYCYKLTMLPNSFGNLKNLRVLDFKDCRIQSLPKTFGKLNNLEVLNLEFSNGLVTLPDSFGSLENLQNLKLDHSHQLKSLPESFGQLSNLKVLNLSRCRELNMLPISFGGLKSLKNLDLTNSGIQWLPESFGKLSNLEVLNLSTCCKLITLPDLFAGLKNLRHLNLEYSKIQRLPRSFGELRDLEVLDLNYCRKLSMLPDSFGSLRNLKDLSLAYAGIESLPGSIGGLSNLQRLNLSSNKSLIALPQAFTQLTNLQRLTLLDCPATQSFESLQNMMSGNCKVTSWPW